MAAQSQLGALEPIQRTSVADQVFDALHTRILNLDLPPGTKMSEADVARQMDVSRQSVRDAFYRLSQRGFLLVQPQRATTVRMISVEAVEQAKFLRTALEVETIKLAVERLNDKCFDELVELIERQRTALDAGDRRHFHELDDAFHRRICEAADCGFAWTMIKEHKTQMDRVRYLSLSFGAQDAFDGHLTILEALRARDCERAEMSMRNHLSQIVGIVARIREHNREYFTD